MPVQVSYTKEKQLSKAPLQVDFLAVSSIP